MCGAKFLKRAVRQGSAVFEIAGFSFCKADFWRRGDSRGARQEEKTGRAKKILLQRGESPEND